ncbi:MAG TPA: sensor histidine kinase [Arachnia sp.]|nr:sensor histidine kinase [Arachnia sp.]HMT87039.1 sensor histidine kinase [Arachnia sp.]
MEAGTNRTVLGALFAAAVANAVLLLALLGDPTGWSGPRDALYVVTALVFAAAFGLLTLLRGRWPRIVLVVAVLTVCTYYTMGLPSIGVVLPLLVFLAATTTAGHRWFALTAAVSLFAVAAFFRIREGASVESILGYELLSNLVLTVLAIALAEVVRTRHELQQSQQRRAGLAAEAVRAETERTQLTERARIAQELHDELGHSLAIISLHANASADRLPPGHPATDTLDQVRTAAAQALRQLREAVHTLGGGGALSTGEPRLTDLDALVDRLRAGGIAVDVRRDHGAVPADVEPTVFRIVQEATTNALRHSHPQRIQIVIESTESTRDHRMSLRISVRNDGAPAHPDDGSPDRTSPGRGLTGLRARVEELGGEVTWGPSSPDQFAVQALIPGDGEPRR